MCTSSFQYHLLLAGWRILALILDHEAVAIADSTLSVLGVTENQLEIPICRLAVRSTSCTDPHPRERS